MSVEPTRERGLVVGQGYYVLDRLADPTEVVTLVRSIDDAARAWVVRDGRGTEYLVAASFLSEVPAHLHYRWLRELCAA